MGSEILYVGVDDGYAETKIVLPDGRRFRMPSQARAGESREIILQPGHASRIMGYLTPEGPFVAGELDISDATAFDGYPTSTMNRVVVAHALRQAGVSGKVAIASGLPVRRYYRRQEKNASLIQAKKENLLKNDIRAEDGEALATITSHEVLAEGIAAWIDFVMQRNEKGELHENSQLVNERIGIVDMGGRTTDIAVVSNWKMITDRSSTIDVGMITIRETAREMLQDQYETTISDSQILGALKDGTLKLWGKTVDVSDVISKAQKSVVNRIRTETLRCLGTGSDLDRVIFVGGTAVALGEQLRDWYPNQSVGIDPAFANARGLQKCAEYLSS